MQDAEYEKVPKTNKRYIA